MRIDAHQHYWKVELGDYDWMSAEEVAPIRRDFLPQNLMPELERHHIDRTVVVQAAATVAETDFLLGLASEHSSIAGVVGWLDVEATDFANTLARYARHSKFFGIRPMLQDLPDDRFLVRPRVLENLRELVRAGATLDLLVLPRHLAVVETALGELAGVRAVVDHCAKPNLRS